MRKSLVIALRDYLAAVRTRAFVISMLFLPLMMGGSIGMSTYIDHLEATKDKAYAIVDRTPNGHIAEYLKSAAHAYFSQMVLLKDMQSKMESGKQSQPALSLPSFSVQVIKPQATAANQRAELSEDVQKGIYAGFLEIGAQVDKELTPIAIGSAVFKHGVDPHSKELRELLQDPTKLQDRLPDSLIVRYQSKNPAMARADFFFQWAQQEINKAVRDERCKQAELPVQRVDAILTPVPVVSRGLTERKPDGTIQDATPASVMAPMVVPVAVVVLMFMMLMVGATPAMQGVVEEKSQRIAEVLLGSVRPFPLMMGKLLGLVSVSLTLAIVYLAAGYWVAHYYQVTSYITTEVFVWFLVYQALAVLMYGSLFIAIGAACTDLRETQTLLMPVMLVASIPIWFLSALLHDPNGPLVTAISFFPPATPMLMVARLAVPPGLPWWQPWVGIVEVLAVTLVCVYAAGRIFRIGFLMQGKGAKLSELMRWVVRG